MRRILVADDEGALRRVVRRLLEQAGHEVVEAADGAEAVRQVFAARPDLVLLDVKMPGFDGWDALGRIRELTSVPVVMLTARAAEAEKVRGLRAGADDYVTKPFGRDELLARVERLLRAPREGSPATSSYADDLLAVDFEQFAVIANGRDVTLTPREFRLLGAFVRRPDRVLTHSQLIEQAWGSDAAVSRDQVKLYVGYLRRKLAEAAPGADPIETVRGFGYRYRAARG